MVPGQGRDERGNFNFSDGRSVVLAGKVEDEDLFVLWDASLHRDFAFSGNAQVRTATIGTALAAGARPVSGPVVAPRPSPSAPGPPSGGAYDDLFVDTP